MSRSVHSPLPLLGGLSAREFMARHWQKRPLLVRNAIAGFSDPLSREAILGLAQHDDVESRLVRGGGSAWTLAHGPFAPRDFARRGGVPWTVLVQDVQHHSAQAHRLLDRFAFIPHVRVDDLMVSFAVDGGGVGPHVDSYDVFLLQGAGRRRWQISFQDDLTLLEGQPLKILRNFQAQAEYVLEPGDMLYLPPNVAHHGVAIGDCLTWSIGFRAPTYQELAVAYLDQCRDELDLEGQYADSRLKPTLHPGAIGSDMHRDLQGALLPLAARLRQPRRIESFLGSFLTEPKSHVFFDPPQRQLGRAEFSRRVAANGIALSLKSRLAYLGSRFFLNGRELAVDRADRPLHRLLADARGIGGLEAASASPRALARWHEAYLGGELLVPKRAARNADP
ncbi:MAG TPA: cupin domain-containing protein [Usitatibacteraceae bacterium]|nr:cupin domain-containing protein [Usitatibacteraceae bacterium]